LFGKLRDDGLKITLLAGFDPLAVFTRGLENVGIEIGFAPYNKGDYSGPEIVAQHRPVRL
jgi:hypothetical protein